MPSNDNFTTSDSNGASGVVADHHAHPTPNQDHFPPAKGTAKESIHAFTTAFYRARTHSLLGAIVALSLVIVAVLFWTHGVVESAMNRKPIYVGVNAETGALMVLRPDALDLKLTDRMLRSAFENFVVWHFQRLPFISKSEYEKSLLSMAARLTGTGSSIEEDRRQIAAVDQGHGQEIQVVATNATWELDSASCAPRSAPAAPCQARVEFERRVLDSNTHQPVTAQRSVALISFWLSPKPLLDRVDVNPLGLIIVGLYESEAH